MNGGPVNLLIKSNRIIVEFSFDRDDVATIRGISGRSWQTVAKQWSVPLDMTTCRALRQAFGDRIHIADDLRKWASDQASLERNLLKIVGDGYADLTNLPRHLPELAAAIHVGPRYKTMTPAQRKAALKEPPSYQSADVMFMATSQAPLNANQPGMGKTLETIGAVFEAEAFGPQLIIAPLTSLDTVWGDELRHWQDWPVFVSTGSAAEKEAILNAALPLVHAGEPCWVVINPHQLSSKKPHPIFREKFKWVTLDEAHKAGLGNQKNIAYQNLSRLPAEKKLMLTGTPMGGKPINLFNLLAILHPKQFTSKWTWAYQWCHVIEGDYGTSFCNGCGNCDGGLIPERKEDFYRSLIPYLMRRTKADEMKWLPPKLYVDRWVTMSPSQAKVYKQFEKETFVQLEEGVEGSAVVGKGVLDIYTRLRQFAIARCEREGSEVTFTADSAKIPALLEVLEERGITGTKDAFGEGKVIVFSQFEKVVTMVTNVLNSAGIETMRITGKEDGKARRVTQDTFQAPGGPRVLCMTTTAGGVAITLDRADTVVFMDQTWNPDNEEQAEDRCHRGAKTSQVTVYYLRTKDTIEDYVFDRVTGKQYSNAEVIDKKFALVRERA